MAAFSDYLENALVNHLLRATSLTAPSNVYVSLHTADPTDAGTGTEVSGNDYARVTVSTTGQWDAPSNGATANTNAITFPTPTPSGWGSVSHFAIWDAATTGNMLFHAALTGGPKTINAGDTVSFAAGALTVTLA
jgi:hypothetical protein